MSTGDATVPAVQLLHSLPDGSAHIDLMIAVDAEAMQPLVTFRLPHPVDELKAGEAVEITALGGHRPQYLTYEGPLSGDRGSVARVWAGRARWIERNPSSMEVVLIANASPRIVRIRLLRQVNDRWILELAGGDDRSPAE